MGAVASLPVSSNPYLDEVDDVCHPRSRLEYVGIGSSWHRREMLVHRYSWAVPNDAALDAIARLGPVVEIGAGTGYWASLLRARGVDVVAFDAHPPLVGEQRNGHHRGAGTWTEVRRGREQMARRHSDRTLFLCWPPYATRMAEKALYLYRGRHIVYVGEGPGGCTGDDRFHDRLDRDWDLIDTIAIPQWPAIHDEMFVYRRRGKP